jgi:hypothetical protein
MTDIADLSFEAALDELEKIVAQLEGGKAPLQESIAIYERGEALRPKRGSKRSRWRGTERRPASNRWINSWEIRPCWEKCASSYGPSWPLQRFRRRSSFSPVPSSHPAPCSVGRSR